MAVSRKTQRNGTFGRLTNVTADRGKTTGKQSSDPGDNLDAGDGSEEDGVDNRSEPQDWLTDGSAESADPAQDGKSPAAVKTAPPLPGSGSRADSPATGRDKASASVEDTADPIPGLGGDRSDRSGWDSRSPGNGSASSSGNGSSGGSKPGNRRPGSGSSGSNGRPASGSTSSGSGSRPGSGSSTRPSGGSGSASGNGGYSTGSYSGRGAGGSDRSDRTGSGSSGSRQSSGPGLGAPVGAAAGAGAAAMSAQYAAPDSPRGGPQTAPFPIPGKSRSRSQRPTKAPRGEQSFSGQRSAPAGFPAQGPLSSRKAQLAISRIEPWSVMKFSFMISLVGWVILFVAVALMYFVLQKIGVFTSIEHTVGLVTSSKGHAGTNAASWFTASRVLGYTMLIGAVNVILITALATIGSVLYNLVTMLAGGIEVTLKETE
jgi:Transmembrane domain of unknown function (DUF3566)